MLTHLLMVEGLVLKALWKTINNNNIIHLFASCHQNINSFGIVSSGLKQWFWYSHALILTTHFTDEMWVCTYFVMVL